MNPDFDINIFVIGLIVGTILGAIKLFSRLIVYALVLTIVGILLLAATGSVPEWTREGEEILRSLLSYPALAAGVVTGFILAVIVRTQRN